MSAITSPAPKVFLAFGVKHLKSYENMRFKKISILKFVQRAVQARFISYLFTYLSALRFMLDNRRLSFERCVFVAAISRPFDVEETYKPDLYCAIDAQILAEKYGYLSGSK